MDGGAVRKAAGAVRGVPKVPNVAKGPGKVQGASNPNTALGARCKSCGKTVGLAKQIAAQFAENQRANLVWAPMRVKGHARQAANRS